MPDQSSNPPTDHPAGRPANKPTVQIRLVADYHFNNVEGATEEERATAALEILRSHEAGNDVDIHVLKQHLIATVPTADGGKRQFELTSHPASEITGDVSANAATASQSLLPMVLIAIERTGRIRVSTDSPLKLCVVNANADPCQATAGIQPPTQLSTHLASFFRLAKTLEAAQTDEDRDTASEAINALLLRSMQ